MYNDTLGPTLGSNPQPLNRASLGAFVLQPDSKQGDEGWGQR